MVKIKFILFYNELRIFKLIKENEPNNHEPNKFIVELLGYLHLKNEDDPFSCALILKLDIYKTLYDYSSGLNKLQRVFWEKLNKGEYLHFSEENLDRIKSEWYEEILSMFIIAKDIAEGKKSKTSFRINCFI